MIAVCRQCGAFIPDENIDYGRLLAKCPGCAAELPIQWDRRKGLLEKRKPRPVDKPARFDVRRVRRSRSGTVFASYILYAVTRDASRRRLLGDLAGPGEAWYLEQEIENALNLDDRLVTEEGCQPRP